MNTFFGRGTPASELLFEDVLRQDYNVYMMKVGGVYDNEFLFSTVDAGESIKCSDFRFLFKAEHISL